ncbi:MAG: N-acetyltransferase [Sphingobacteriales bacterium]|nr:MAG: N-acetyltransferase [Sphingobacteriales bacterium]
MELRTPRLLLQEVSSTDLLLVHGLNSLPEVDEYNTLGIPENLAATRRWLEEILIDQIATPQHRYVFKICETENAEFIGLIGFTLGKVGYSSGEVWYKIMPAYWSRGFATESVKSILEFGFGRLKLHRIEAGCATENTGSVRVLEKNGFTLEGRSRKLLPIRGNWVDNFRYAILEEDFTGSLTT